MEQALVHTGKMGVVTDTVLRRVSPEFALWEIRIQVEIHLVMHVMLQHPHVEEVVVLVVMELGHIQVKSKKQLEMVV
jgi:hypothetical protein